MKAIFASLHARLIFLVLLAFLPPLGLVLLTYLGQQGEVAQNAQDEALRLARQTAEKQQALVAGTQQLLTVLSQLPLIEADDPAACNRLLANLLAQNTGYANLGVIELDGTLVCSALPLTEPVNLADRTYFQRAVERRDFAAGDYQVGRVTGISSVNFGYPVFDAGGDLRRVVFAALALDWLNEQAAGLQLPPDTAVVIVDRNGTILARYPDPEVWVGQRLPEEPLIDQILARQGEGAITETGVDGINRLYAFTPLNGEPNADAYVIVSRDVAVVYDLANELLARNLAALALLAVFILAATRLFGERFILRRVNTLLAATERLAAGDLAARTTLPYGISELSRLSQSFDEMAATLQQRTIEREVSETKVLQNGARAEALARTATRLNAQLELEAILSIVCEETAAALDFPLAIVYLYNKREDALYPAGAFDISPEEHRQMQPIPFALYEPLFNQLEPAGVIPDLQNVPGLPNAGAHLAGDVRTVALAIMRRDGQLIGALGVFTTDQVRAFGDGELSLLRSLADQATQAISNARLFTETRRRLGQLQALNAIDQAIIARFTLADALHVVLEQAITRLQVDAGDVLLLDPQTQLLSYAAGQGFQGTDIQALRLKVGEGYAGRAVQERQLLFASDITAAEGIVRPELPLQEGFVAYYSVPLATEQEVIGVLNLFHRSPRELEPDQFSFLKSVAAQAAIVVDNLRLYAKTQDLLQRTHEQAQQMQQIMDTLPEGVLLIDRQHRLALANPLAQEYLPLLAGKQEANDPLTHLGGRPLDELLRPIPAGELWQEITLSEQERIFEIAARPIGEEGQEAGWVVVLADVTEAQRRQEYFQNQDRLATVGQLAAGMAHDFNNIMTIITLYAGTIAKIPDHLRRGEYLETITEQAHHASRLIGQMLDFSRTSVVERSRLDLLPFVKELVKLLKRTLPETIVTDLVAEEDEYPVRADPTRLQQALMNLAVNARDAMPEGGKLSISLSHLELAAGQQPPLPEMQPGRWVRLAVADTGSGIPPDALSHIFEPFFTTKERGRGTGLGLAQVYGIVKQHEGEIEVVSRPAQDGSQRPGTTFILYLPVFADTTVEQTAVQDLPSSANKGETILLVEDDVSTQEAVRDTLIDLNYKVLVAGTGREALALFDQNPEDIDLVLSDMVMPEMGGIELYRELRQRRPGTKVVLMSGYPPANITDLKQDRVDWMMKPFTADELAYKVRQVLND